MLPNQEKAFWDFYNTARHNEVLDDKTTLMLHLAASMAVGCYPCMRTYLMQKESVKLTDEEIGVVESIVMAVSAGRVMMQHKEAFSKGSSTSEDECVGPC
jgi:alkylhydroperoxidase/carboxymuconolactone decarboxylase family protein YurZ